MRVVNGRVLQLETGAPIPNLVVAAFDVDRPIDAAQPDFRGADRLGSAATDSQGSFRIEFRDEDFERENEGDGRPDLIIALFRPHVVGAPEDPDAKPLFVTRSPRAEAGRGEAFVVLVPRSVFHGEPVAPTRSDDPEHVSERIMSSIAARARFDAAISRGIEHEVIRQLSQRKQARTRVRRILGTPRSNGQVLLSLPLGTSLEELMAVRKRGMKRLADTAHASTRSGVRLGPNTLERLGAARAPDGRWIFPETEVTVGRLMQPQGRGPERFLLPGAYRTWSALDRCRDERLVNRATSDHRDIRNVGSPAVTAIESGTGSGSAFAPSSDLPTSTSIDGDLVDLARDAVFGLSLSQPQSSPTAQEVIQPLEAGLAVELPLGPADVPSFHDFHTLQVAWPDVWTALIDGELEKDLTNTYESLVPVMPASAVDGDNGEIQELNDFMTHLEDAVEVASAAVGAGGTPPDFLATWMGPEFAAKWGLLSAEEQLYVEFLKWIDDHWQGIEEWALTIEPNPPTNFGEYEGVKKRLKLTAAEVVKHFEDATLKEEIKKFPPEWFESVSYGEHSLGTDWRRARLLTLFVGNKAPENEASAQWVPKLSRASRLLEGIRDRLSEPCRFDVFYPGSYNFGILTTYRQKWQPLKYQVGDLVGTIPLAPGEKRTYTKKRVVKTSRAQKEVERSLAVRSGESAETVRSEAEIIRKASSATNFKMSAEGGFNVAVANAKMSGEYGANQAQESAATKRSFREGVRKAAEEYRRERTLEISTDQEVTDEFTESGEIRNTNDELTVTYLLYELQRRIEVSERLHGITPVVLVAFDVPAPHEVDEDWLLAHQWILRRVMLDDGLLPALDYLSDTFAGDEVGVEVLRTQWETQIETVRELNSDLGIRESLRATARSELATAIKLKESGGGGGILDKVGDLLFGDDSNNDAVKAEARRKAAQQVLDWADLDFTRAEQQLMGAVSALTAATEAYSSALRQRLNRRVAIDQLRIHVKDNILYYMQAVWLHEPSDQRYLRVYDKQVIWPPLDNLKIKVEETPAFAWMTELIQPFSNEGAGWIGSLEAKFEIDYRLLHTVADVDTLLGFKGNYAIFPLKEYNAVTLFMAQEFLDEQFGARDPDPYGQVPSPSEAVDIAECAWHRAHNDDEKRRITTWLLSVLENGREVSEEIIVPTAQLYIDALPGSHPLLEQFKLRHRAIDVEKARAEMVQAKLEAMRYAARINSGELADPEVQTQVVLPAGTVAAVPASTPAPGSTP